MTSPVPVLLYHSISDRAAPGFRRWTVAPDRFAAQMRHLAERGYTTLRAAEYAACLRGEAALPERPALVTFDDGYADFGTAALPVLRRHGITATLFVTTGYVGGTSQWLVREQETDRPMLTWEQLAALDGSIELGGHGHSHRAMDTLPLDEAVADIARGKELLETRTGRGVESFAYPHGYSTRALRRRLSDLGFTSAHGVVHAMSSTADRPFSISRIVVDAGTSLDAFIGLVGGEGIARHPLHDTGRQLPWRWWRRARLQLGLDRPDVPA